MLFFLRVTGLVCRNGCILENLMNFYGMQWNTNVNVGITVNQ